MIKSSYQQTNRGGLKATRVNEQQNRVEIFSIGGNLKKTLNDVTDLREARRESKSGDTIRVNQGQYVTRNLLKNNVNWHFEKGAKVFNPESETGAIFENVGAHGSPSGPVTSRITGNGEFTYRADSNTSGDAILNIGIHKESDIYFEAKKCSIPSGKFGQILLAANGNVEMHVDYVSIPKENGGSIRNALASAGGPVPGSVGDTSETNINISVNELDFRGSDLHGALFIVENSNFRGVIEIDVNTLYTDQNSPTYLAGTQGSSNQGYVKASVHRHVGSCAYGVLSFSGDKPIVLENFDFRKADTDAISDTDASAVLYYTSLDNVSVKDCMFKDDFSDAGSNNYTIKTLSGTPTLYSLGGNTTNGIVGSNVNVEGEAFNVVSRLDI